MRLILLKTKRALAEMMLAVQPWMRLISTGGCNLRCLVPGHEGGALGDPLAHTLLPGQPVHLPGGTRFSLLLSLPLSLSLFPPPLWNRVQLRKT